jgi:thiamine pyrophosphokinase
MKSKKCIILANGAAPEKGVVKFLSDKGYETLIAADGGANTARALKLVPDYIVGDLDSAEKETLEYFENQSSVCKIARQDDTDVEKCIKFAIRKKMTDAVLLGVIGDRLDHSFCNLGIAYRYSYKINLIILSGKSMMTVITGDYQFPSVKGEVISMYGIDGQTRVTTSGLKYPVKYSALEFGVKESTSNVATGSQVKLHVLGGKIFLIRDFETVKMYDLF